MTVRGYAIILASSIKILVRNLEIPHVMLLDQISIEAKKFHKAIRIEYKSLSKIDNKCYARL